MSVAHPEQLSSVVVELRGLERRLQGPRELQVLSGSEGLMF